jgi:hypothetical protein
MQAEPSSVRGVELIGPGDATFEQAITALLGRAPGDALKPALPYSVIVRNTHSLALALIGIRFDMIGRGRRSFSVVHYADMLRHAERAALTPGAMRFVCAEPLYTDMVMRGADEVGPRGPMNLEKLRTVDSARASLDCAAFADGWFGGRDSLQAFERFEAERVAELAFITSLLEPGCEVDALIAGAGEVSAEKALRALARKLSQALEAGGREEALACARDHRVRIVLHREPHREL